MRRGSLLVLCGMLWFAPGTLRAVAAESWSIAGPEEFAAGTLESTALDGEGRVVLAPALEPLWGPDQGIVWDVASDGSGGAFVALSSPSLVLHLVPGEEPEFWHATGDETLVAAILPDRDRGLYMGLSPDGRLMHAGEPGETEEVADTGALFIWALAAGSDGSVWIGTGLPGRLLRLDPQGRLHPVFDSGDDPVRCIAALDDGRVVFGTGGRGRVVRVGADDPPFVVFDADEAEIVALDVGPDGSIYALTATGSKQVAAARSAAAVAPQATVRVTAQAPETEAEPDQPSQEDDAEEGRGRGPAPMRFRTPPGGALYRIAPRGDYQQLWQAVNEVPFGLVRREDGTLLVGTGDRGRVHAVDDTGRSSILLELPSDQASALGLAPDGSVLLGGTTDARVMRVGPGLAASGDYLSAVHDAGTVAEWGRVHTEADLPSGSALERSVRAGNSAEPDETWTDWVPLSAEGSSPGLPSSRWLQVRLTLRPNRRDESPRLRRIELFYRPANRRPFITELVVQPPGVVWTRPATASARPVGPLVADDPVSRRTAASLRPVSVARPVRRSYELGARTISWTASDPDGDTLGYRLDLRREGTENWIPLAVEIAEEFVGWDTRAVPDGLYRVRLVASDAVHNPEGAGLTDERVSGPFWIDNTRPSVAGPRVERHGAVYEVRFRASDPGGRLAVAEVAVDAGTWQPLIPDDGVADSAEESYRVVVRPPEDPATAVRPRTVRVRVSDAAGNLGGDAWALEEVD